MTIRDLPIEERPRELGEIRAEALSNAELLAIILRTGTNGSTVIDVANELLKKNDGNLVSLFSSSLNELKQQVHQIAYEQNSEAQERASRSHRKTVLILCNELLKHGLTPKESVVDVFTEKANQIFIFEVKSIHTENFKSQTRKAIGQLLEYEYFEIKKKLGKND
ncbi:MAG: UPF0758 domain-containing protein, partial [Candidatus Norongarragalinales archaeon]